MRTIVSGNNIAACGFLNWLIANEEEVAGIIAENHDCAGEDIGWERPFAEFAERMGGKFKIPVFFGDINKYADELRRLEPDLIASCRTVFLVKPEILRIPKKGVTNLHYGMLPRYGGCDTIAHAILDGEREIGITLHYMDESFDSGDILEQMPIDMTGIKRKLVMPDREIEVEGLTGHEVYKLANRAGVEIYCRQYSLIKTGREETMKQDSTKKLYHKRGEINYEDNVIDLETAGDEEIGRHVRAFTYPAKKSVARGTFKNKTIELRLE